MNQNELEDEDYQPEKKTTKKKPKTKNNQKAYTTRAKKSQKSCENASVSRVSHVSNVPIHTRKRKTPQVQKSALKEKKKQKKLSTPSSSASVVGTAFQKPSFKVAEPLSTLISDNKKINLKLQKAVYFTICYSFCFFFAVCFQHVYVLLEQENIGTHRRK